MFGLRIFRTNWISYFEFDWIGSVIVKASSGPRYVVGCRNKVDKEKLTAGTRVVLDMTTLTIMRALPREVNLLCEYLFRGTLLAVFA